jgi:alpha-N-arabinofuranosidase
MLPIPDKSVCAFHSYRTMRHPVGTVAHVMLVLLLFMGPCGASSAANQTATITVYPNSVTGPVNRNILGNNVLVHTPKFDEQLANRGGGIWDPARKKPVDEYVALAKKAGVSFVRWPGGDHSRILDWKLTVGPVQNRATHQFGLPEFLTFCAAIGAQPIITVATKVGSEADAADLVEYLNAPDNGKNPNGGVDWAAVRTRDGHKEPWNVVWFEYGNEEFNSNRSVNEYVGRYQAYQTKMKAVDPKIKLGAVFEDSTNVDDGWTYTILKHAGRQVDFGVIHPYLLKLNERAAKEIPKNQVALSAVSADADLAYRLTQYRELIKRVTGRDDLPLAVTEYNGDFTQEFPVPYRYTLVNALHNADFVRIFLKPELNVALATYWLFSNSYWGLVSGYPYMGEPLVKQANYYVYELYNKYLGDNLIRMEISAPRFEFPGALGISPRVGATTSRQETAYTQNAPKSWDRRLFREGSQSQSGDVVTVDFDGKTDANYFHATREIDVEPDTLYKISVKARTIGLKEGRVGIAVEDIRGWDKNFFQPSNVYLSGTTDWSWVTVEFRTPADAKKIRVLARRHKGGGLVSGRAEFGEMRVVKIKQSFGAVESVVGTASIGAKGNELSAVVINKNMNDSVETVIDTGGSFQFVSAESLTGPSPFATNSDLFQPPTVKTAPVAVRQVDERRYALQLPAASVTGIMFRKK